MPVVLASPLLLLLLLPIEIEMLLAAAPPPQQVGPARVLPVVVGLVVAKLFNSEIRHRDSEGRRKALERDDVAIVAGVLVLWTINYLYLETGFVGLPRYLVVVVVVVIVVVP